MVDLYPLFNKRLKKNEEIDSLDLREGSKMRTIVLDCCRKVEKDIITEAAVIAKFAEARAVLNASECRNFLRNNSRNVLME